MDNGFSQMGSDHSLMERAWNIVRPYGDWRGPISFSSDASILARVCERANVTIEDLCEAIVFYTATRATVRTVDLQGADASSVVYISAAGYRAGPAGDH